MCSRTPSKCRFRQPVPFSRLYKYCWSFIHVDALPVITREVFCLSARPSHICKLSLWTIVNRWHTIFCSHLFSDYFRTIVVVIKRMTRQLINHILITSRAKLVTVHHHYFNNSTQISQILHVIVIVLLLSRMFTV